MNRMRRVIFITILLTLAALTFAAPYETSLTPANTPIRSEIGTRPIAPSIDEVNDDTLYFWTFTQPEGWSFYDASDAPAMWHPDTFRNGSADSAWWCGTQLYPGFNGYANYWYQVVQTPMLDLSGATTANLACKMAWNFEPAGTPPAPYTGFDGLTMWISTNGGNTFVPLTNVSPAYTCSALFAAGTSVWNLGTIPGYSNQQNNFALVTANLANYRQDSVVVRWSVLSDRAISGESRDSLFGAYLDSVRITDGTNILFQDNGGAPGPNSLRAVRTYGFGQHWEWSNTQSVSAPTSAHCDDDFPNQQSCLISPWLTLPQRSMYLRLQVRCDMPDTTQGTSTSLRDYYMVDIQGADSNWTRLYHDYARGGHGYPDWYDFGPGDPYNSNTTLNLSQWAGQPMRIRIKAVTDYDNNPSGTGIWIDDVRIFADNQVLYDVVPAEMRFTFPTTVGRPWTVPEPYIKIANRGRGAVQNMQWWVKTTGDFVAQTPVASLLPDSTIQYNLTWNIAEATPGTYHPAVRIQMPTTPPELRTLWVEPVVVRPAGQYELGYNSRHFWMSDTLADGRSYAVRFTPTTDGFSGGYSAREIRFATMPNPVATSVHVRLMTSSGTRPGVALIDTNITIPASTDSMNIWTTVDLSGRPEGRNRTGFTYVVLDRVAGQEFPIFPADSSWLGIQHTFNWGGGTTTPVQHSRDLGIQLVIDWPANAAPEPVFGAVPNAFALSAHPNPFNSTTSLRISIPTSGQVRIALYDVMGREALSLYNGNLTAGQHVMSLRADALPSGMYLLRATSGATTVTEKIVLMK
ncbi:MAG: T9SS type A sorting domain-containing protein [bacterium]|nr:T9SS type A sorting domain-containing protein [bacterium]